MVVWLIEIITLVLILLTAFGLLGPKRLRDAMRRFNTWYFRDSALFLPIDPYKPLAHAMKEGVHNFWPTKERVENALFIAKVVLAIALIGILASLAVVLIGHALAGAPQTIVR